MLGVPADDLLLFGILFKRSSQFFFVKCERIKFALITRRVSVFTPINTGICWWAQRSNTIVSVSSNSATGLIPTSRSIKQNSFPFRTLLSSLFKAVQWVWIACNGSLCHCKDGVDSILIPRKPKRCHCLCELCVGDAQSIVDRVQSDMSIPMDNDVVLLIVYHSLPRSLEQKVQ